MKKDYVVCNTRDLCVKHCLIDPEKHRKYTELEMVQLLDFLLLSQERRLIKAKKIYREQVAKIEALSSPELWRFGTRCEAPPDYKAEYLRRIEAKSKKNHVVVEREQGSGL